MWRLTYLVRFKGRLYAGLQDYEGVDAHDYVVVEPPLYGKVITQRDVHPVRATKVGGNRTLRWYADDGKLYWIARSREGARLRVTEDGETWRTIEFPRLAGAPTDVTRFRGVLVALTERGLYRLDRDSAGARRGRALPGRAHAVRAARSLLRGAARCARERALRGRPAGRFTLADRRRALTL